MPNHHLCPHAHLQWYLDKRSHEPLLLLRSHLMPRRHLHYQKTSPLSWSQNSASQINVSSQISRERKASAPINRSSPFHSSEIEERRKRSHRQRSSPQELRFRCRLCRLWLMKSSGARVAILHRRRGLRWHMCRFERIFTCFLSMASAVTTWSSLGYSHKLLASIHLMSATSSEAHCNAT